MNTTNSTDTWIEQAIDRRLARKADAAGLGPALWATIVDRVMRDVGLSEQFAREQIAAAPHEYVLHVPAALEAIARLADVTESDAFRVLAACDVDVE